MPIFLVAVGLPQIHGGSEKAGYDVLTCWPSLNIHGEDRDEASKSTFLHQKNRSFTWQLMSILDALLSISFNDSSSLCCNLWQRATVGRLTFHRWNSSLPRLGTLILGRMFKHVQTLLATRIKMESDTVIWYIYIDMNPACYEVKCFVFCIAHVINS